MKKKYGKDLSHRNAGIVQKRRDPRKLQLNGRDGDGRDVDAVMTLFRPALSQLSGGSDFQRKLSQPRTDQRPDVRSFAWISYKNFAEAKIVSKDVSS